MAKTYNVSHRGLLSDKIFFVPEMTRSGHLSNQDGETDKHRTVEAPCGSFQLQQTVQVAAEQVELSGLEVLGRFHGAPDALWDFQEELDLGGHGVELILPLPVALK